MKCEGEGEGERDGEGEGEGGGEGEPDLGCFGHELVQIVEHLVDQRLARKLHLPIRAPCAVAGEDPGGGHSSRALRVCAARKAGYDTRKVGPGLRHYLLLGPVARTHILEPHKVANHNPNPHLTLKPYLVEQHEVSALGLNLGGA